MKPQVDLIFFRVVISLLLVRFAVSVPINLECSFPNQTAKETDSTPSVFLDTIDDRRAEWIISATNSKKWFEYYNSTDQLKESVLRNNTRCASAISNFVNQLAKVEGIWVACHDPALPQECFTNERRHCHPSLKYSFEGTVFPRLNTIKLSLAMKGSALVRLSLGSMRNCYDFSVGRDPLSSCKFIQVEGRTGEWEETRFELDPNDEDSHPFGSFVIEFITKQRDDAVMIDKVESYNTPGKEVENHIQFAESPNFLIEETTAAYGKNITLDRNVYANDTEWTISRIRDNIPKWFEYYNTTELLMANASNTRVCANVISDSITNLEMVEGIWVACQDPTLPPACPMGPNDPCHPFIKYSGSRQTPLRTVKIYLALHGLAIARFTGAGIPYCIDFSARKDQFSSCRYIETKNITEGGWMEVKTPFDGYDNTQIERFTIELIARFKDDAVLVDKIEATDMLLCEDGGICTTTPAGTTLGPTTIPTRSTTTPAGTTLGPTTIPTRPTTTPTTTTKDDTTPWEDTTITTSTATELTEPTTTEAATTTTIPTTSSSTTTIPTICPSSTDAATPTPTPSDPTTQPTTCLTTRNRRANAKATEETTLETIEDASNNDNWEIPSLKPRWLEYHSTSAELISQAGDTNSCASIIASAVEGLQDALGIWSSCQDPGQLLEFGQEMSSSPPTIHYSSKNQRIISVNIRFYLHGSALLRIHLGNECLDGSVEPDPLSSCKFINVPHDDTYWWRGIYETTDSNPFEQPSEFRIELLSRSVGDVVLVDKVVVGYDAYMKYCDDVSTPTETITTTNENTASSTQGTPPTPTKENTASSTEGTTTAIYTDGTTSGVPQSPETSATPFPCTTTTKGPTPSATPSRGSYSFATNAEYILLLTIGIFFLDN